MLYVRNLSYGYSHLNFKDGAFWFGLVVCLVLVRTNAGAGKIDYVSLITFRCFVLLESVICSMTFEL